jgi:hypothetical protein
MRKPYLLLLLVPVAVVWACGGDDSSNGDGGPDAVADTTTDAPSDSSNDAPPDAGDSGAEDATPDITLSITCLRPANCIDGGDQDAAYPPSSGEVCCGTIVTNGDPQNCNFTGVSTACSAPSGCATSVSFSCGTDTVRLCTSNTECTEQTYNKCCSVAQGDASIHFCANTIIANAAGGSCP